MTPIQSVCLVVFTLCTLASLFWVQNSLKKHGDMSGAWLAFIGSITLLLVTVFDVGFTIGLSEGEKKRIPILVGPPVEGW